MLLGPLDLGNHLIAKDGMLEMMLVMAGTDDILQQKVQGRERSDKVTEGHGCGYEFIGSESRDGDFVISFCLFFVRGKIWPKATKMGK